MCSGPTLPGECGHSAHFPHLCPYLKGGMLTGGNSELEEELWSVSSFCWLVQAGMLARLWWSSLALPNLMLSYSTVRSRITNTERAMPVKGGGVTETWAGKLCSPSCGFPAPVRWQKAPPPVPSQSIPSPFLQLLPHPRWAQSFCTVFPLPVLSWQGWPTGLWL